MKNNIVLIIVFVILAVLIIWGGMWYNQNSDQQSQSVTANTSPTPTQTSTSTQPQTMDGLQIKDITVGTGATAQNGNTVTVNYTGTLDNGTKFDSSFDHGQPFSFVLGAGSVIKGWDVGVLGMKVGGKRELVIAPVLGYGARANGPIPANSTLHFDIELLAVTSTPLSQ